MAYAEQVFLYQKALIDGPAYFKIRNSFRRNLLSGIRFI